MPPRGPWGGRLYATRAGRLAAQRRPQKPGVRRRAQKEPDWWQVTQGLAGDSLSKREGTCGKHLGRQARGLNSGLVCAEEMNSGTVVTQTRAATTRGTDRCRVPTCSPLAKERWPSPSRGPLRGQPRMGPLHWVPWAAPRRPSSCRCLQTCSSCSATMLWSWHSRPGHVASGHSAWGPSSPPGSCLSSTVHPASGSTRPQGSHPA